jgi:hypothetical protein
MERKVSHAVRDLVETIVARVDLPLLKAAIDAIAAGLEDKNA